MLTSYLYAVSKLKWFVLYQAPVFTIKNQPTVNESFLRGGDEWWSSHTDLHHHHLTGSCYYNLHCGWLYLCNTIQWHCLIAPSLQCLGTWKLPSKYLEQVWKMVWNLSRCFESKYESCVDLLILLWTRKPINVFFPKCPIFTLKWIKSSMSGHITYIVRPVKHVNTEINIQTTVLYDCTVSLNRNGH